MLSLSAVKKSYGPNLILDIPQALINPGLYWLKGQNGAGKSTFMKILAGMIPFEGEVIFQNIALKQSPTQYRKLVNYAEAEPLYPTFVTGADLVHYVMAARQTTAAQVDDLQARFGITRFVKDPVGTYSSGMLKKLSLVLAFTGTPGLVLLDEPLVTIDKETIPVLYELISDHIKAGIHIICASHQPLDETALPPYGELSIQDHQLSIV